MPSRGRRSSTYPVGGGDERGALDAVAGHPEEVAAGVQRHQERRVRGAQRHRRVVQAANKWNSTIMGSVDQYSKSHACSWWIDRFPICDDP